MELPAIIEAVVPIPLPNLRRLERMPPLPEWLASRVASMKDETQPDAAGKWRTVPTMPTNLILSAAQRETIERHVAELTTMCERTPANHDEAEAETLVILTKMMMVLPTQRQNEASAEARGEAFMMALDDVPSWAVAAAVRRWYRGDAGENERGEKYDCHWCPSPADLRDVALTEHWRVKGRAMTLTKMLAAESLIEYSDEHCAAMRARVSQLMSVKPA